MVYLKIQTQKTGSKVPKKHFKCLQCQDKIELEKKNKH